MRLFSLFSSLILATSFSSVAASAAPLTPADLESVTEYEPFNSPVSIFLKPFQMSSYPESFYLRIEDAVCKLVDFSYGASPQMIFKNKPITADGEEIIVGFDDQRQHQKPGTVSSVYTAVKDICFYYPTEGIVRFDFVGHNEYPRGTDYVLKFLK